ncbi:LOW QUALITY PROTEIN: hypothetical protein TorRG33x02_197090, partial [Trema orientale]
LANINLFWCRTRVLTTQVVKLDLTLMYILELFFLAKSKMRKKKEKTEEKRDHIDSS